MRTKKLTAILITILFVFCIVLSGVFVFSVKKVNVKYKVGGYDSVKIQKELDKQIGKNLLFLDLSEVYAVLEGQPYLKIISVKKQYPNVISVELEERKEVYFISYNNETYLLDETGFVLKKCDSSEVGALTSRRDLIALDFKERAGISEVEIGKTLKTLNDQLFESVLEVACSINLYDTVKSISIVDMSLYDKDMEMQTYAGGKITVRRVCEDGVIKIKTLMLKYNEASDYVKMRCEAVVFADVTGEIKTFGLTEEEL